MFKKYYCLSFLIFSFSLLVTRSGFAQPAMLSKGDAAPVFTTQASLAGSAFNFSLKDALAKGPVVVYFYPSAYTGGCDLEAHTFAELKDKFTAAGATIIGVSADDIQRLNSFSSDSNYCAGKFPVASDPGAGITSGLFYFDGDPYAVFVNGDGTIARIVRGAVLTPSSLTADERALIPSGT